MEGRVCRGGSKEDDDAVLQFSVLELAKPVCPVELWWKCSAHMGITKYLECGSASEDQPHILFEYLHLTDGYCFWMVQI